MTVSATNNYDPFIPNGVTLSFPFTFHCDDPSWVTVVLDNVVIGGFTVSLNPDQITAPGGTVLFAVAPTGTLLIVKRETPLTQLTAYDPYSRFPAASHEAALDKLTMQVQDFAEVAARTAQYPIGTDPNDQIQLWPVYDPDKVWAWDPLVQGRVMNITNPAIAAAASATEAAASAAAAAATYDQFDDRYLGSFFSDPTLDNDGNPLLVGALYWNQDVEMFKVYTGIGWSPAPSLPVPVPLTHGGTGATNAQDARISLGFDLPLPVSQGGTGWTTVYGAQIGLNVQPRWIRAAALGSSLAITTPSGMALTALNSTDVAYIDGFNDALRTYRFDGSAWALVGSGLAITGVTVAALAALNTTDVAFIDSGNDSLRTYRFNGSTWAQVGSGLAIPSAGTFRIAALSNTDIALIDSASGNLRTYRFDGANWAQEGNALALGSIGTPSITALSVSEIAMVDDLTDNLRLYQFDGLDWTLVGNELLITTSGILTITALNMMDVAMFNDAGDILNVYRFTGLNWEKVSNDTVITGATAGMAMVALNGTDIAFVDDALDTLRAYRFAFYTGAGPYRP